MHEEEEGLWRRGHWRKRVHRDEARTQDTDSVSRNNRKPTGEINDMRRLQQRNGQELQRQRGEKKCVDSKTFV